MTERLHTVVLEDSQDDRFLIERALRKSGIDFSLSWAGSRQEFVRALEAGRPDVIISDCVLPDIDAVEAIGVASRIHPGTPIILVTGGLSDQTAVELMRAGAHDYLLKDRLGRLGPAVLAAIERAEAMARRCRDSMRLKEALLATIRAILRTVDIRDPYTAGHQVRVAEISAAIGSEFGWDDDRIEGLRMGASLHDIGKIWLPSEILSRPAKLTPAEFAMVRMHCEIGRDIVKDIDFPWPIARMILEHHERLDGTGYPHGLRQDQILLEARIIAVADVVEAMSSHRPYRPSLGIKAAIDEITAHRGTRFDAQVVDACLAVVDREPALFGAAL
jgi:HD-GYP domain-containing protein (c-di-GMP phosphodiesterase class II)